MFIKRKYTNRHRILEALQKKMNKSYRPDAIDNNEFELSWNELVKDSGLNEDEVLEQIDYLLTAEEVFNNEVDFSSFYLILQKGTTSFHDRKYINVGRKEFKDDLYDVLKICSGFILLLIATITFVRNIMVTEKNNKEIDSLKNELKAIKSQLNKKSK
jgi:hypothetical protein